MTAAPIVTTDHMQRAYAQLRRPEWPALEEMQRMATQFAIVRGRACALAMGRPLPAEPVAHATLQPGHSARAAGHTERHRRASDGPDRKCLAAGERRED